MHRAHHFLTVNFRLADLQFGSRCSTDALQQVLLRHRGKIDRALGSHDRSTSCQIGFGRERAVAAELDAMPVECSQDGRLISARIRLLIGGEHRSSNRFDESWDERSGTYPCE